MFVAASDFDIPPLAIPNLEKVANTFSDYVTPKEKEALIKLLGRELYDQFIEGLPEYTWSATVATVIGREYAYGNDIWQALTIQTGTAPVAGINWTLIEEDNIWLRLKNGDSYEYGGVTYQWEGMTDLLKPYIFSQWLKDDYDSYTGVGVAIGNAENSTVISPNSRIIRAWNDYADKAGSCSNAMDTLYGFLINNQADYPDWVWCDPGYMNSFNF